MDDHSYDIDEIKSYKSTLDDPPSKKRKKKTVKGEKEIKVWVNIYSNCVASYSIREVAKLAATKDLIQTVEGTLTFKVNKG